jgi:hypothetical protein
MYDHFSLKIENIFCFSNSDHDFTIKKGKGDSTNKNIK